MAKCQNPGRAVSPREKESSREATKLAGIRLAATNMQDIECCFNKRLRPHLEAFIARPGQRKSMCCMYLESFWSLTMTVMLNILYITVLWTIRRNINMQTRVWQEELQLILSFLKRNVGGAVV